MNRDKYGEQMKKLKTWFSINAQSGIICNNGKKKTPGHTSQNGITTIRSGLWNKFRPGDRILFGPTIIFFFLFNNKYQTRCRLLITKEEQRRKKNTHNGKTNIFHNMFTI